MTTKYDNKYTCQACGGNNKLGKFYTDGGHVSETETICTVCGEEGYWAYGFFEREPQLSLWEKVQNAVGLYKVSLWWSKLRGREEKFTP